MNRVSIIFAVLLASGFVFHAGSPSDRIAANSDAPVRNRSGMSEPRKSRVPAANSAMSDPAAAIHKEAGSFINDFLDKGSKHSGDKIRVLFASLPDPVETHLASIFDHDVAALQDGIEDSGYLFDSSWIPWQSTTTYDKLVDNIVAESIQEHAHEFPGILLFRKNAVPNGIDPYESGLIVFLITEKPTGGLSRIEMQNALAVLNDVPDSSPGEFDLLMPTFSGSLPSLVPVFQLLDKNYGKKNNSIRILIRSSGVTGDAAAHNMLLRASAQLPKIHIDFGSAQHRYKDWIDTTTNVLLTLGIDQGYVLILTEDESGFGQNALENEQNPLGEQPKGTIAKLAYPRDISALRSSYEKQGLLDRKSAEDTFKQALHLSDEEDREGDTIRSFGQQATLAAQESVLFGIRGYIRSHNIRAVILVATSEEDRYFLTEFLHANNPGVRVVILGATRLFMRGSTAQFRGDMMVSDFPMLARLYDWTSLQSGDKSGVRIFADDYSQGTYVAARDLLLSVVSTSGAASANRMPTEYSEPPWLKTPNETFASGRAPPIYLSALGADSAWPVGEDPECFYQNDSFKEQTKATPSQSATNTESPSKCPAYSGNLVLSGQGKDAKQISLEPLWKLMMPFRYGDHFAKRVTLVGEETVPSNPIHTGHMWKGLFCLLWVLSGIYVAATCYANPVVRRHFAYLYPSDSWRYWLFAVSLPAFISGTSFLVLAWAHRFPVAVLSCEHLGAWYGALFSSICIPAVIACVSLKRYSAPRRCRNTAIGIAPAVLLLFAGTSANVWHSGHTFKLGEELNIYREMYWESGISLVPSALLLLLAIAVWGYFAAAGGSILEQCWRLPEFGPNERIATLRGQQIIAAARPIPTHPGSKWFWAIWAAASLLVAAVCEFWPSINAISSLEGIFWTKCLVWSGWFVTTMLLLDLIQFVWAWAELRDLLQALDRVSLKRSFVPLREFNWSSIWSFSGGSFQDRRKVISEQLTTLVDLEKEQESPNPDQAKSLKAGIKAIMAMRNKYSEYDLGKISVATYESDMGELYRAYANIGGDLAKQYLDYEDQVHRERKEGARLVVNCCANSKDRFEDEERAVEELPKGEGLIERFICLTYIAFIQTLIVRLRGLVFSFVSLFSLLALSVTIYPFQPMLPLLFCGFGLLAVIAVTSGIIYSQMDKDPVLSRVLNSDPTKLEGSFYSKLFETLAPPLLALLSATLPGGGGRLVDLVSQLLNHG